jgi:L-threonylcarbamoyladenylate synthase
MTPDDGAPRPSRRPSRRFAAGPVDPARMEAETTTEVLALDEAGRDALLRRAAAVLANGGIVVMPTESFYGLAVRAQDAEAVRRLAELKGRDPQKPIPLVAALRADAERVGTIPSVFEPLLQAFWPGPLTVALPARGDWPPALAGDTGTIGVRIPGHVVTRRLAALAGGLLTATSANFAGAPPPTAPAQLDPALVAGTQLVIDAGLLTGGQPSTVVGEFRGEVVVLRAGAISVTAIERVLGRPIRSPRP